MILSNAKSMCDGFTAILRQVIRLSVPSVANRNNQNTKHTGNSFSQAGLKVVQYGTVLISFSLLLSAPNHADTFFEKYHTGTSQGQ